MTQGTRASAAGVTVAYIGKDRDAGKIKPKRKRFRSSDVPPRAKTGQALPHPLAMKR